jgi:transcriptional regulator of heat shock response
MITARQNQILSCLIREYIKTAEPVGSDFLSKKYDFGICPSAIRIELQDLIKNGYLEQPHTSAGRIPTDKAYRLFVNDILEKENKNKELEEVIEKYDNEFKMASQLTKYLAEASSMFSTMHLLNKELSWQAGWEEISKEPEFSNQSFLSGFVNFLDDFDENIKKLKINDSINVFIGKEIPSPKAVNLSLVCSKCSFNDSDALIVLIGPKRMNYDKNIRLINSLNNFLDNLYE